MSTAIAKDQVALMKAEGKLKKLFKAIKKLFAKEFLWMFFVALLALPLALILNHVIVTYGSDNVLAMVKKLLEGNPVFTGAYGVSIAGIYFTRVVIGSIKTLTNKVAS